MRGGPRPNCGRRGLKTIACRIPQELYETIAHDRLEGETFPQAALRLFVLAGFKAPERHSCALEGKEARV
ncbi:MAG: hypothetical protein ABSE73_16215 [Planctomycetota bacterium]